MRCAPSVELGKCQEPTEDEQVRALAILAKDDHRQYAPRAQMPLGACPQQWGAGREKMTECSQ